MELNQNKVLEYLKEVYDPELGINIVDLGLVYGVVIEEDKITVNFTLTTPACPVGDDLMMVIEDVVRIRTGVKHVEANIVWEPQWGPHRLTEEARLELGYPV